MNIELPPPIAAYFAAANAHDMDAVLRCFAAEAVVHDEGQEIRGAAAIRAWKDRTDQKYSPTATPTALAEAQGRSVVTASVSGNFPGSPLPLRYFFTLGEAGITELEIKS